MLKLEIVLGADRFMATDIAWGDQAFVKEAYDAWLKARVLAENAVLDETARTLATQTDQLATAVAAATPQGAPDGP